MRVCVYKGADQYTGSLKRELIRCRVYIYEEKFFLGARVTGIRYI